MNIKKIAAFAAAAAIAAGICTGAPIGTRYESPLAITAEAAKSDFVIETNDYGEKYLAEYKGKGGDIVIPKEIKLIDTEVFAGNDKITSVTVKGSNVWLNPYSFAECKNLKKVVFEGDATIGGNAFDWCYNLESVVIKGSIDTAIYDYAFYGCHKLKTVKIGKNANDFAIGAQAFRDCYSLTSINIPSKCTEIYGCAFLNCFSLEKLTVPAKTKINTDNSNNAHFGYAVLYNTEDECWEEDSEAKVFVADGKTSGYAVYAGSKGGAVAGSYTDVIINTKKYTPKKLTLTVTKGSPAEKWAKKNKVAYTYAKASSGSGKTAAPENFKASKTNNSITLTWGAADGADMYRVYKYNEATGKYEKYKDVKSAKCAVSGLSANTKYKFKVTAYDKVNGKYVKGGTSKAVSVTTKK